MWKTTRLAMGALVLAGVLTSCMAPGSPKGALSGVRQVSARMIFVYGWVFDPDQPRATGAVFVTVDGVVAGGTADASADRPLVGAYFPDAGPLHGFDLTLPVTAGSHQVCAAGVNVGQGDHILLGCIDVVVGPPDAVHTTSTPTSTSTATSTTTEPTTTTTTTTTEPTPTTTTTEPTTTTTTTTDPTTTTTTTTEPPVTP